jgi:hypothetical protein
MLCSLVYLQRPRQAVTHKNVLQIGHVNDPLIFSSFFDMATIMVVNIFKAQTPREATFSK